MKQNIVEKALNDLALALPDSFIWSKEMRKTYEKLIREAKKESIPIKYIWKQWSGLNGPYKQTEQNTLKRLIDGWKAQECKK